MKTVVEIKDIDKQTVLDSCLLSCEAKQCGQDVLLWYYTKCNWKEDLIRLKKALGRKIRFGFFSWYDKRFFNIPLK